MTNGEALVLAEQLLELANRIKTRSEGAEVHVEFDMLYGRLRGVVHHLIPKQPVQVQGNWKSVTTHDNLIEAGYLSGMGTYEYQGYKQLTMLVGMLRERAAKDPNGVAEGQVANATAAAQPMMVDSTRLDELRSLPRTKFDFSRLVRLCEEVNEAFRSASYHAVAFLVRGIMDHIPPVFGFRTFSEVANNHGTKSFKESMEHLDKAARKIANAHLHTPIRASEVLPNATQVNFGNSLDVLLAEVVRISRS